MISLKESKNDSIILSFIQGEGVRRRCLGGFKEMVDPLNIIKNPRNIFLIAEEGGVRLGFVALFPHTTSGYSIHVCLRTLGDKTKKIISMAFNYARHYLNASEIYAFYPKKARAVQALCSHFGFKTDKLSENSLKTKVPEPYNFQVLILT